jgi:Mycoplasma protein of unknown function, DUF285
MAEKSGTKTIVKPKDRFQLRALIGKEIMEQGNDANLNHIDVSEVTDFSRLFFRNSKFCGDVSSWRPTKALTMWGMFERTTFVGDLSTWTVRDQPNAPQLPEDLCSRWVGSLGVEFTRQEGRLSLSVLAGMFGCSMQTYVEARERAVLQKMAAQETPETKGRPSKAHAL